MLSHEVNTRRYSQDRVEPQQDSGLQLTSHPVFSDIWNELLSNSSRGAIWRREPGSYTPVDHLLELYLTPNASSVACGGYDLFSEGSSERLAKELVDILRAQGVPSELSSIEEAAFAQMITDAVQTTALVQAVSGSDRGDLIFLRGVPEPDLHVHQMQLFAFGQYRFGTRFANTEDIQEYDGFTAELKPGAETYAPEAHSYVFAKGRINGDPRLHAKDIIADIGLPHCSDADPDGKRIGLVAHSYYAEVRPHSVETGILQRIADMSYSSLPS